MKYTVYFEVDDSVANQIDSLPAAHRKFLVEDMKTALINRLKVLAAAEVKH